MKKKVKNNTSVNNKLEIRGTMLVFLTALISGISIVINKFFVVRVDPLVFTAIRALFIGLIFFIISLAISKKTGKKFKKVSWKYLLLIGIIGGSFAFWTFFSGLKLTTAGRAAILHKTLPIYATIFGVTFLKEKVSGKQLAALFLMLFGIILIELTRISFDIRLGDFLIIAATILWAIETTISKKVMLNKESNWVVTFSRMFFGSVILFAIIFLTGNTSMLLSLTKQQMIYIIISTIFLLLYVLTFYWGLKYINLSKASTILLLAPVISLVLGVLYLNEKVMLLQFIGTILILIGAVMIYNVKSIRRKENYASFSTA